jgi:hypothetical protein
LQPKVRHRGSPDFGLAIGRMASKQFDRAQQFLPNPTSFAAGLIRRAAGACNLQPMRE